LGKFIIFVTIIVADIWKLGQMRPGDEIKLLPITTDETILADVNLRKSIEHLTPLRETLPEHKIYNPILTDVGIAKKRILNR